MLGRIRMTCKKDEGKKWSRKGRRGFKINLEEKKSIRKILVEKAREQRREGKLNAKRKRMDERMV